MLCVEAKILEYFYHFFKSHIPNNSVMNGFIGFRYCYLTKHSVICHVTFLCFVSFFLQSRFYVAVMEFYEPVFEKQKSEFHFSFEGVKLNTG